MLSDSHEWKSLPECERSAWEGVEERGRREASERAWRIAKGVLVDKGVRWVDIFADARRPHKAC